MTAFGLTPQGYNRMLEADIIAALRQDLAPLFGVDPSTTDWPTPDSPLSQLLQPFSRQLGLVHELAELAFQGLDPDQATGTLLDGLLSLNAISRLEAASTEVLAALSGTEGTVVPAGTRLSIKTTGALFQALADAPITKAVLLRADVVVSSVASTGTQYQVTLDGNVVLSGVISGSPTVNTIALQLFAAVNATAYGVQAVLAGTADVEVATIANASAYVVTLDGVVFTYTSDSSATSQEIVDGLVALINAGSAPLVAAGLTSSTFRLTHAVPGTDWTLALGTRLAVGALVPAGGFSLKASDLTTPFALLVDSRMAISKLYSPQTYNAVATGPQEAPAGTLTVVESNPISGFSSVTNFLDGTLGRDVQADDAARVLRQETLATGDGTDEALVSRLRRRLGSKVSLIRVYENDGDNVDALGRPPHSVEVLIVGGKDKDVAQAVWLERSSGINPVGNINSDGTVDPDGDGTGVTIQDSNGEDRVVKFSRPQPIYAFLKQTLTLYSEEDFPVDGEAAVALAQVMLGNGLGIGKDFLLQRFVGPAVSVPGVARTALQIAISTDPDDVAPTYGTADIAVSQRQVLKFDTSRVTFL